MSEYDPSVLEQVKQWEEDDTLAGIPSMVEVMKALTKLKNGKATGSSGILPEMLKVGRKHSGFVAMLRELLSMVWEERQVP